MKKSPVGSRREPANPNRGSAEVETSILPFFGLFPVQLARPSPHNLVKPRVEEKKKSAE